MLIEREKFATQIDRQVLANIRQIAREEGRQLQVIVEEALKAHIEQRARSAARPYVIQAYQSSLARFDVVYGSLSKL